MSRIGKKPIIIPSDITVTLVKSTVSVKGSKGELSFDFDHDVLVTIVDNSITVNRRNTSKRASALWGTTARLIENMIYGISRGFQRQLELNGVGYRMAVKGKVIEFALGFSHPVIVQIPEGLSAVIENNILTISGIDKQLVGQFAANIRSLKPVEPYKGKGFKYTDEIVRRKEGKRSAA